MTLSVRVQSWQRGLYFRNGDFAGLRDPGMHRLWRNMLPWSRKSESIELVSPGVPRVSHPLLDALVADARFAQAVHVVDLTQAERALVWADGRLAAVLGPGRAAFWKAPARIEIERFSVDQPRLEHPRLEAILDHPDANRWLETINALENHDVLLLRNGQLVGSLAPGRHAFWKGSGRLGVLAVDKREQLADVAGQEIMTADKVTLRVNLLVAFQVVDAVKALTVVSDSSQAVYREAQLALRAAVGGRTLDAVLADKQAVGGEVAGALAGRVKEFGVVVRSVGIKDIVLPGEMKTILNSVLEAQKRAEAELIKRREETAAARSQANTAKLLADNPVLARMRELELLQGVLAGTKATFVLGPGDVVGQVRSLLARDGVNAP